MPLPPSSPRVSKNKEIMYLGRRPQDDQDNLCRTKMVNLLGSSGCFYELYPEKLYLISLAEGIDSKSFCDRAQENESCPFILWNFNESNDMQYEGFNMDFGPFNLAVTHQFCSKVKLWLDTQQYRKSDKYVALVVDSLDTERKLNATLAFAISSMVLLGLSDKEVIDRLQFFMMSKEIPAPKVPLRFREKRNFIDVSGRSTQMELGISDCIEAFYAAMQYKFYDYYEFDQLEYLFYETIMSGDLNWIIPGKILAFAGPCDRGSFDKGSLDPRRPPSFYYHYFRDHNVTSIIRLNEPEYDSATFTELGFEHHDLIFPDGYPPTSTIARKFIKIVDEAPGAVAVHCFAGIGRTGTLIAAYLMAKYNFTAQMAVAWTRICRPGSVIGEQQDWLFTKFYYPLGGQTVKPVTSKQRKNVKTLRQYKEAQSDIKSGRRQDTERAETTYAALEKTCGQAKALVMAKSQRERQEGPATRSSNLIKTRNPTVTDASKLSSDFVIDLGKTKPLMLNLSDFMKLKGSKNPDTYCVKDGKYEWRVRFPRPDYVYLKHNYGRDLSLIKENRLRLEDCRGSTAVSFIYEHPDDLVDYTPSVLENGKIDPDSLPKLQPVVYYNLGGTIIVKRS